MKKDNNYVKYAKSEFKLLGWPGKDDMQKEICDQVIKMLEVFGEVGHSGSSAMYTLSLFESLAKFKPVAPLTGEDNEWTEVATGIFQNKRCGTVFKEMDQAYDIDGRIFIDADGSSWTNYDSRVDVEFPYTQKSIYVKRQKIKRAINWIKYKVGGKQ